MPLVSILGIFWCSSVHVIVRQAAMVDKRSGGKEGLVLKRSQIREWITLWRNLIPGNETDSRGHLLFLCFSDAPDPFDLDNTHLYLYFWQTWVHSQMLIQNNFPFVGFVLLPNIRRANISWECLAVIQNLWRENYFEWAFMNGPKSALIRCY